MLRCICEALSRKRKREIERGENNQPSVRLFPSSLLLLCVVASHAVAGLATFRLVGEREKES